MISSKGIEYLILANWIVNIKELYLNKNFLEDYSIKKLSLIFQSKNLKKLQIYSNFINYIDSSISFYNLEEFFWH